MVQEQERVLQTYGIETQVSSHTPTLCDYLCLQMLQKP